MQVKELIQQAKKKKQDKLWSAAATLYQQAITLKPDNIRLQIEHLHCAINAKNYADFSETEISALLAKTISTPKQINRLINLLIKANQVAVVKRFLENHELSKVLRTRIKAKIAMYEQDWDSHYTLGTTA